MGARKQPEKSRVKRSASTASTSRAVVSPAPSTAPSTAELANEGQRQLLEIPDSLGQIATRTGYSRAIAGAWRQGKKLPAVAAREVLEREYRIPARAWDLAAGAELDEEDDDEDEDEDDELEHATGGDVGTLAEVDIQIRETKAWLTRAGRVQSDGPSEAVRARKQDTLVKLLKLKALIERDLEIAEDRFLRGPKFKLLMQVLRKELSDLPDRLDRIEAAVMEIGG